MSDDAPTLGRTITGDELRGADRLMQDYFHARTAAGEKLADGVEAIARMAGMSDDFIPAALAIAADRAQVTMIESGAPADAEPDLLVVVEVAQLHRLIMSGYVHGIQMGTLAGVGITDPST